MPAAALIINADDLGYGPSVDRGIFAAWAQRAIGDSTAFANTDDLPLLLQQAGQVGLPVGIHL
ncbi:MAG TPA: ChbG/HpnK family deacetylase, partial [Armatimonadota bacterium]